MRIALVGLGDIAQKAYLPLLASDERVTPLLCTRNPAVLAKLARQYRIAECFTEVDALLASRPDAVMIHAATVVHFALAEQCLRAGIPTFVDKPLCDTLAGVEELANLALAQNRPLFVGFNRRYLPAMSEARGQPLTELNWQKHRHALAGAPRSFLFDDFIHVLDSLCYYGDAPDGDLHAVLRRCARQPELLAGVSVAWQSGQVAVSGSMNRSAGLTEERIDAYGDNLSLHIENCTRGTLARDKTVQTLAPDDWQSVLTQRGFAAMLAHWYQQIEAGRADGALIESYLHGHRLAEQLVDLAGSEGGAPRRFAQVIDGLRVKKSPDHCMRWRIPAQLIGGGAAAQAKRALVCYLGGHELPAERQSVMNQLLKRGGRLAALAKRERIPAMMARVARP